ncbi:hypothetical protein LAZ67_1003316 [Cordylochernes scorpioides]|uniref:Reverse transcriptase domain-containing protein n=1 Tax=Cordylochernes scorpioides TaxID=51811 RepID=A0ABY6JY79_9ARAC|nr:hypothetical protein LAZ67_1003316 [Cordylochernes scorpioides]
MLMPHRHPEICKLFRKFMTLREDGSYGWDQTELRRHAQLVMQALETAVEDLDDSSVLASILGELGRRHGRYGVREEMFDLWDRWSLIKAGLLAEALSLHIPRHYTCDDSYIGRAQRLIRAQLEASSINADYPSLPDLARLVRHRRPAVTIRNEDGAVFDGLELRRRVYDIFQPRFARAACDPTAGAAFIEGTIIPLDIDENDPLHREDITLAEIAAAISRLPSGRAPGWDGLPCELLVAFVDFFAGALWRVFTASHFRGALPPSTRRSSICLVPKTRGGRGFSGYRPISLPSADYRVLAGILLRRLRHHLPALVPECQTYVVSGRAPSWNIAWVTDAVEEATAGGLPLAVVCVDLESAFDSLDRGFLWMLLESLRLPSAFMKWIRLLYAEADSTIRAGDFHTTAFHLLNGLRKGCAVSVPLFNIATGPLLRRLESFLGVGNVIAYADDITLLIRRDEQFERVEAEQHLLTLLDSACRKWTPFTRGLSLVGRAKAANTLVLSTTQHYLHGYLPGEATITKLQGCLRRFIRGPDRTAWLPAGIVSRPVTLGGLGLLDIGAQLHPACLKGVQAALPPSPTATEALGGGLQDPRPRPPGCSHIPAIGAPHHWWLPVPSPSQPPGPCALVRVRVADLRDAPDIRPTRSSFADAAALVTLCRRTLEENLRESTRAACLAEAVVLPGTNTPFSRLTTRSARRALERPRLAAQPITRLLSRWTSVVDAPARLDWTSLRCCAFSGHDADIALRLALHALPHPNHPASTSSSCQACGSVDRSLDHRYWSCSRIEAFSVLGSGFSGLASKMTTWPSWRRPNPSSTGTSYSSVVSLFSAKTWNLSGILVLQKLWDSLQYGMQQSLKSKWTPEVREAWFQVFHYISWQIIRGLRSYHSEN